jgi:hypothetical protein
VDSEVVFLIGTDRLSFFKKMLSGMQRLTKRLDPTFEIF